MQPQVAKLILRDSAPKKPKKKMSAQDDRKDSDLSLPTLKNGCSVCLNKNVFKPHSNYVTPMLTDLYQLTMVYSYWKQKKHKQTSCFDLFFRRCPFKGQYAIFCGLEDCLRFISSFSFSKEDIAWLKKEFPAWDAGYFDYLEKLDSSEVEVHSMQEGLTAYPRVPLLRVEGPLGICQLIETTLLNLVNYATLVATNAARHRVAVGPNRVLLEFGLRRAQGSDGGMSASRYSYIGGYNGTSNVLAAKVFNIPCKGTHAHSYVSSFRSLDEVITYELKHKTTGQEQNVRTLIEKYRREIDGGSTTNNGELAAFAAYGTDYPTGFLALIDTYNTITSGMINFIIVALALDDCGYRATGVRIDSGNLTQQSLDIRQFFKNIAATYKRPWIAKIGIIASNDIDEKMLQTLAAESEVTGYGVGTRLVTCKNQPALGGVYKLTMIGGHPRIKISQERHKMTIPGKKMAYRMYGQNNQPICDILTEDTEPAPQHGKQVLCRDYFNPTRKIMVEARKVEKLLSPVWKGNKVVCDLPTIQYLRDRALKNIEMIPEEQKRSHAPNPYPVLLTDKLYNKLNELLMKEAPVERLGG